MAEKKYLDYDGLQAIAQKVNARLKTETTMPDSPSNGAIRLYVGDTDGDFVKGHVYQAHVEGEGESKATSWSDITPLPSAPIIAKGTIKFEDLDSLENVKVGWMYNIEDDFVTDERFAKSGVEEKASSNVYCIEIDGEGTKKWDVFAAPETVKVEEHYDEESDNAQSGKAVAEAVKPYIKAVSEMPEATEGDPVAYVGKNTADYVNGHLYRADPKKNYGTNWTSTDKQFISGGSAFNRAYLWTDGDDYYYSKSDGSYKYSHFVFNKETQTWTDIERNSTAHQFTGEHVWHMNGNTYTRLNGNYLSKVKNFTFTNVPYSGFSGAITGIYFWTDNDNTYYSIGNEQYVVTENNGTIVFSSIEWKDDSGNKMSFYGNSVWSDGEDVYYSRKSDAKHYILDKENSIWIQMDWPEDSEAPDGAGVWKAGDNIYCSASVGQDYQLAFDKTGKKWKSIKWTKTGTAGDIKPIQSEVWTDGENVYWYNFYLCVLDSTVSYNWLDLTAASNPTKAITREDVNSLIE